MARPPSLARVGLLGGSFDPIHAGHLQLARDAHRRLALDEVRFIPAGQPWQKGKLTEAAHRAHMVELAIRGLPGAALDMREIERAGRTYTIDTLRELRSALGDATSLVLLMGADQFERIDTWRDWAGLLDFAHIAVAARNGEAPRLSAALQAWSEPRRIAPAELATRPAGGIVSFVMAPVDASATHIRELLSTTPPPTREALMAAGVPAAVLDYIRRQGLYKP